MARHKTSKSTCLTCGGKFRARSDELVCAGCLSNQQKAWEVLNASQKQDRVRQDIKQDVALKLKPKWKRLLEWPKNFYLIWMAQGSTKFLDRTFTAFLCANAIFGMKTKEDLAPVGSAIVDQAFDAKKQLSATLSKK